MAIPDLAYVLFLIHSTAQVPWFLAVCHSISRALSIPSGTSGCPEGMWKYRGIDAVWGKLKQREMGNKKESADKFTTLFLPSR